MSLTGPLFLGGILAVTLVAFVGLVVLWPRLTGRSPWRVVGRVVALVVVNLLVLLTAATQLNAAYLFFASWGDLDGALSGHITQSSLNRGGDAAHAADRHVRGHAAKVPQRLVPLSQQVGQDGLSSYTVHGAHSGLTGQVLVQLPSGFSTHQTYPVLEAFHGYPSEPLNWVKIFDIRQQVEAQVQAHALRPTIVVMPQIEIPRGVDTEGVNGGAGDPQVETWLTRDVPDWVAQHFPVEANRNGWATIGYSAGGYDAAMATVLHPAQFGGGIVLGGYFRPEFGPFYEPFLPDSPQGQRYDLTRAVAASPPPVSMWVETSHADALSYGSSAAFLRQVRAPMAVHAVVLRNAGHRDSVWIALLPQALQWLGTNLTGFQPQQR
jgi:enterochelin esterase-like enzyme